MNDRVMRDKLQCPNCGESERVIRHGTTISKVGGRRQRYKCQNCATTFYNPLEVKADGEKVV